MADALDMAKGRSRIPFERGSVSIHSLSAAAIDGVRIADGQTRPVMVEIVMNNSSGIYQVDGLEGEAPGVAAWSRTSRSRASTRRPRSGLVPVYRLEIGEGSAGRAARLRRPLRGRLTV